MASCELAKALQPRKHRDVIIVIKEFLKDKPRLQEIATWLEKCSSIEVQDLLILLSNILADRKEFPCFYALLNYKCERGVFYVRNASTRNHPFHPVYLLDNLAILEDIAILRTLIAKEREKRRILDIEKATDS